MKRIQGYLLDREDGSGVSGKDVFFEKLDGSPVTTTDTYFQDTAAATDSDGFFRGEFELSPGPIITRIDVDGIETKIRMWDEMAQFGGGPWGSDLRLLARAGGQGVIRSYLNELAVSNPSGHTIRVGTGAAIFNGNVFSIEETHWEATGSANPSGPANPRVDLIYLRQWNHDAAGQNAGKQEVIILEGSTSNVAPAVPTNASWVAFPLAIVSTAQGAGTKTVSDRRVFANPSSSDNTPLFFGGPSIDYGVTNLLNGPYVDIATPGATGLNPNKVYDGYARYAIPFSLITSPNSSAYGVVQYAVVDSFVPSGLNGTTIGTFHGQSGLVTTPSTVSGVIPIIGLTGVSSFTFHLRLQFVEMAGSGTRSLYVGSSSGVGAGHCSLVLTPR